MRIGSLCNGFAGEVVESLVTITGFVVLALAWLEVGSFASAREGGYAGWAMESPSAAPPPRVWLVDGFNLLHTAVLRGPERPSWWKEAGRERVIGLARRFDARGAELFVVFDGARPLPDPPPEQVPSAVQVVFAPSADEWLLARIRAAPERGRVAVVTADRRVASRARRLGAQVVAPRSFVAICGAATPEPTPGATAPDPPASS